MTKKNVKKPVKDVTGKDVIPDKDLKKVSGGVLGWKPSAGYCPEEMPKHDVRPVLAPRTTKT